VFWLYRSWRRSRLADEPFPEAWNAVVERMPFFSRLTGDEREQFLLHLKVFALERHWLGAHELVVTDEMKVVVSACAARLSRNLDLDVYDDLGTIILYPTNYTPPGHEPGAVLGQAHKWGTVVLSWDAVKAGLANQNDGRDTALHEFAHVLDLGDRTFDGTPELHEADDYRSWAATFSKHYFALRKGPKKSVLRDYGATNEAEFFAVATEAFFEKPLQLQHKAPDLYEELQRYYRVDPAASRRKA
jgi:MtfA peptidase